MLNRHPQPGLLPFLRRTVAAQIHFVSLIVSVFGTIILTEKCSHHSPPTHIAATLIFGLTSIFLFATSSLYHLLYDGYRMSKPMELWFEKLDHIAIFLFISGTYTAVLMNAVSARWANLLLAVIWCLAALGILYTLFKHRLPCWIQHRYAYTAFFLIMGWVFTLRLSEIFHTLSTESVRYLLFGGFSYSIGAFVYAVRKPNFIKNVFGFHELWHVFVAFGYGFHYLLISGFY